jgi:excisionase family DNA binding protein
MSGDGKAMVREAATVSLMDIEAAAGRLGVSVRYIRRLVFDQRLPYVKVGKFVRFDPVELEQWIDDRRVEAKYRTPA